MFEELSSMLLKTPLFEGLVPKELTSLLNCTSASTSAYRKSEVIAFSGDVFREVGMVVRGEAIVSKENTAGERLVMTYLKQGDLFGEMLAFTSKKHYISTVEAKTDCLVLYIPKEKIVPNCFSLCRCHRVMIQNYLKILSEKSLLLSQKIEYLRIRSIRGKIAAFLLDQYEKTGNRSLELPFNRNEMAEFLNISRPSMSREMGLLKREEVIDFHKNSFRILDPARLKAFI